MNETPASNDMDAPDSKPSSSDKMPSERPSDCSASGVDRSLIRWMLSLSPAERLLAIQQQVNAVQQMKGELDSD